MIQFSSSFPFPIGLIVILNLGVNDYKEKVNATIVTANTGGPLRQSSLYNRGNKSSGTSTIHVADLIVIVVSNVKFLEMQFATRMRRSWFCSQAEGRISVENIVPNAHHHPYK